MTRVCKKSVLLGCRDAGSAYNLVEAVKFHRYKPRFDIQIFCQSPAYEIFKREGLDPIHVEPAVNDRALSLARKIIQQVKPDAILTGVSGPDIGIDEALIASSQHDNTYVFQDFWGYINRSSKYYAKHYFVVDKEAERLTHLLYPNLSTTLSGPLKYNKWIGANLKDRRERCRNALSCGKNNKILVFFGQPLWHNAGYQKTLEHLIHCMQENQVQNLYYTPHPKERLEHFDALEQLAVKYAFFHLLNENFQQDIFFSADIFLSSSSTSLYDAAYINKLFNNDATKSIALLFDDALKAEYRKINGFDGLPFVDNQSIISVDSPDDLSNVLFETLNNQSFGRGNYACASSPTGTRGCEIIWETIDESLASSSVQRRQVSVIS